MSGNLWPCIPDALSPRRGVAHGVRSRTSFRPSQHPAAVPQAKQIAFWRSPDNSDKPMDKLHRECRTARKTAAEGQGYTLYEGWCQVPPSPNQAQRARCQCHRVPDLRVGLRRLGYAASLPAATPAIGHTPDRPLHAWNYAPDRSGCVLELDPVAGFHA
jgi:hypothetical protein